MTPTDLPYREIPLTQGQVALVDAEDYERLSAHKWYASLYKNGKFYARRSTYTCGKRGTILMQREVLNLPPSLLPRTDHRNPKETLDNRKYNLRIATPSQNQANIERAHNNTSGFKGVSWHKRTAQYKAQIRVNGINIHLGYRRTAQAAHLELYVPAAIKHFGEFARAS